MRVSRIFTTLALATLTLADVEFTSPSAGASVAEGTIKVEWKESGTSPPIDELTGYTLSLMTGGDDDTDMLPLTQFVSQGDFTTGNKTQGTIPAGIAEGFDNGFFFRIVSTAEAGGTVINYSPRFSITGLTGSTPLKYKQALEALDGSTTEPDTVNNVPGSSSTTRSTKTATSSAPSTGTAENLQTSSISKTAASSITSSTTALSGPPSSDQQHGQHGLSTGAIAGIAIAGAIVGLALLAAIGALVIMRRRRSKQAGAADGGNAFLDDKAELCAEPPKFQSTSTLSELGSDREKFTELSPASEVFEAPDGVGLPELDHRNVRAELE